jgi:hypothetical protein
MDEDKFWQVIEAFDWSQTGGEIGTPAVECLSQMKEEDLLQFDEILASKLYALDTQAHATCTGFGVDHFSVDSFLYTRCHVVARGRDVYHRVAENASLMPRDAECEWVLYLTTEAAEQMGLDDYDPDTAVSYETFSNEVGWQDASLPDSLPPGHKPKHQR